MNKRFWFAGMIIIAALLLWLGMHAGRSVQETAIRLMAGSTGQETDERSNVSDPVRTKVAIRSNATHYTHGVHRLREFMLPAMVIEGLTLDGALRQLMASYEEACRKSGETPLPLTFEISPGANRKLTIHLPAGNFKTSVRLLAALFGMKISRKDLAYRFEPIASGREAVKRSLKVSPHFQEMLNEMAGLVSASPSDPSASPDALMSIERCLGELGLLDPSTHVSLGASGELNLETTSVTDTAVISELVRSLADQSPMLILSRTTLLELPVGTDWTPPGVSWMSAGEVEKLMQEFALSNDARLETLPSITQKNGQNATVENIREIIYPTDDAQTQFEKRNVGRTLNLQNNLLGFGHEMNLTFTDTTASFDPFTGMPVIGTKTEMTDNSFTGDGETKLIIQTRADGSRAVLLVKHQMIEADGQPVH